MTSDLWNDITSLDKLKRALASNAPRKTQPHQPDNPDRPSVHPKGR